MPMPMPIPMPMPGERGNRPGARWAGLGRARRGEAVPAGGAAAPPGGTARGCPPAPHARPRPRWFVPGRGPGSSPRVSQGAVIHGRIPAPGPGEPQGAGPAVCRHRQPPRWV